MLKKTLSLFVLAGALAAAHADPVLITEGFDDVSTLTSSGWLIKNEGSSIGPTGVPGWFQGDQQIFPAKSGAADAYAAANYGNVPTGGTLSTWLITPTFSTATDVTISFWARADILPTYLDRLAFGLIGASGDTNSFVLDAAVMAMGGWTQYTMNVSGQGAGSTARFAIEYFGNGDEANFVGVDDLTVTAADARRLPEPASWALVGVCLLGVAASSRRRLPR